MKLGGLLKEKCLRITVTLGPFKGKIFTHYNCYWGTLWMQSTIQLLLGPFESKVLHILQLQRGARGKCLVCLLLNQGFPTFFLPCTPSAFRQMSMYPWSISTDKDVPFIFLTDEHEALKLIMTKYFVMIFHRYI